MVIDAWCSEVQYLDHVIPVWAALDPAERGHLGVAPGIAARAILAGLTSRVGPPPPSPRPVLTASYRDAQDVIRPGTPVVLMEHGAGQSYAGLPSAAYAGGEGRGWLSMFLCPSERVAAVNRATCPDVPNVVIGSPRLDAVQPVNLAARRPTVVVSHHWDCHLLPETRWSWPHYAAGWADLRAWCAAREVRLFGHAHPRNRRMVESLWRKERIPMLGSFDEVLAEATVYVVDNSSTLYEAAAVGIPVLAMNAPWFRRDVEHGLRFWSAIPGRQVDDPADLLRSLPLALADDPGGRHLRETVCPLVFGPLDGGASTRATTALRQLT